jgi:hypothetical protein
MATLIQRESDEVTFQVTARLGGTMLEMEEAIQGTVNDLCWDAAAEALQRFQTDGSSITLRPVKRTADLRGPC